jgi:hypothetical protein
VPAVDNSAEIKRLQGIIADCESENTLATRLIKTTKDEAYQTIQSKLIEANLKKIKDCKD